MIKLLIPFYLKITILFGQQRGTPSPTVDLTDSIATRLTANEKLIEKQKAVKILGVWLQEDGGWQRNVDDTKQFVANSNTKDWSSFRK